jgi:transposase
MCPIPYYDFMRNCKDKSLLRYQVVFRAQKHGIKPTARAFGVTPDTVRKWRSRFETSGYGALRDQSRRPYRSPRATPEKLKQRVIALKDTYKRVGADQIKHLQDVPVSSRTMRKIWREAGCSSRKRRKKHETKRNLREIKKKFNFLQHTCEDTKELTDIPEYYSAMRRFNLPTVQFTFRDMSTGTLFMGFGSEKSATYAGLFADYLQQAFVHYGIDLSNTIRQTDNGSEYTGGWKATHDSAYTKTIRQIKGQIHQTIPVRAHRYQADVETVHDIIEREFFELESFTSRDDFFNKVYSYQLFFNLERSNSYKEGKTPWQLAKDKIPDLDPKLLMLPAVDLDDMLVQKSALLNNHLGVYDVSSNP